MPNSYFRFKEFTVHQDKAAMKVCTDSCLFGAWVVSVIDSDINRILDVGTGTGLLSLMLAQVTRASIDAVEIDESAYQQAAHNFEICTWNSRLKVYHSSIQEFHSSAKYDVIITNPPFYHNDLTSPDEKRNIAIHSSMLSLPQLIDSVQLYIKEDGVFAVMLPPARISEFENLISDARFYINKKCSVKQTPSHAVFRYMYLISKTDNRISVEIDEIIIRDNGNKYTDRFYRLLKDYYLFGK